MGKFLAFFLGLPFICAILWIVFQLHQKIQGADWDFSLSPVVVVIGTLLIFFVTLSWKGQHKKKIGTTSDGTVIKAENSVSFLKARIRGYDNWRPNLPAPGRWSTPGHDVVPVWKTFIKGFLVGSLLICIFIVLWLLLG